jgi:hypothetical protein
MHGPSFGDLPQDDASADARVRADAGRLPDGAAKPPDPEEEGGGELPTCASGTVAVLAGDDGALGGAVQDRGGAWVAAPIPGSAAKSKPALTAFGAGFLAVTHGPGDVLQTTTFAGTWSPIATIGAAGVKGAPSLAVVGANAHVVYAAGPDDHRDFMHGIHDGGGWNAATAPVGNPPTIPASFGTVSAGLAAVANQAVFVENGSDEGLYVRSFAGTWSGATPVFGAGTVGSTLPATPEAVALEGKFDLLIVYVEKTTRRLSFATREAASAALVGGTNIDANANTAEKLALALVSPTEAIVTFRGQDGKGYYSQATIGDPVTWSIPAAIGGDVAPVVDSTPAVARGVCGDDAVVVYASSGAILARRLRGTTWSAAESIGGISGSRVGVATR